MKIELPYDPTISFLSIYPKEMKLQLFIFFSTVLAAYGSSWARDWAQDTSVTYTETTEMSDL